MGAVNAYEVGRLTEGRVAELEEFEIVMLAGWLLGEVDQNEENARMLACYIDLKDWYKRSK